MAPEFDVLSYGTIGIDLIIRVPHWPRPDLSTHANSASEYLGGKAINTAVHLARWGLDVSVSGSIIGDDAIGRKVIHEIGLYPRIDTTYLRVESNVQSMYCIILVGPEGDRAIVGIHTDMIKTAQPSLPMISSAKLLTLDLYGGPERITAARLGREAGIPVIVGDLRSVDHEILPFTTIAISSAAELRLEYPDLSEIDLGNSVLDAGAEGVIITDGAGPVLAMGRQRISSQLFPPHMPVIDATGAGDAFRAGVVYGYLAGYSLPQSAALGVAAGTLAVGRPGAANNPAGIEEVRRIAEGLTTG